MWGVLALWVSQTEPHGMLCAPVETSQGSWWLPGDPLPSSPRPASASPTMGKWTVAGNCSLALLLKQKRLFCWFVFLFFFLFLNEVPCVSSYLGTSPSSAAPAPGSKSSFFTPNSSAEGRGWGLKAKPEAKGHSSPHLQPRMWQGKEGAGPVLPHGARR